MEYNLQMICEGNGYPVLHANDHDRIRKQYYYYRRHDLALNSINRVHIK